MTTVATDTDPLQRCVGDVRHFAEHVWGSRAMVRDPGDRDFRDLLSLDDVDLLLSGHGLRTPAFRLVKDGSALPVSDCTRSARIGTSPMGGIADASAVFGEVERGATLVLQALQRYWPPLARFCRDLELALGHQCQVNAYVTPPGSQGFAAHADTHDVFVLQVFGTKTWQLWPSPGERATGEDAPGDTEERATTVDLRPGSVIYLPTGTRHAARTQRALSGHLTIGIHPTRWRDVMRSALRQVLDEPAMEAPLPVGFHRDGGQLTEQIADHLRELSTRVEKIGAQHVADDLVDRFLTERPPSLRGGLADHVRLPWLDDSDRLRRRAGAVCELRSGHDGSLRVLLGDREVRMPGRLAPALRDIVGWDTFHVCDLAPHLDASGRLVLARRLVREGMLEFVDE